MKVLVVDDDVVSRMVLMHLIDACGSFDICEAEDGEDAWQQLAAGLRPAICFCDLRMPRLSGMDLLQRIKADSALGAMPFVMVTSATDRATIDQAAGLGVNGYLVKPFDGAAVAGYMAPFGGPAGARAATPPGRPAPGGRRRAPRRGRDPGRGSSRAPARSTKPRRRAWHGWASAANGCWSTWAASSRS